MTTSYRVLVCDARSDQLLATLPISGLSYEDYIGKDGVLSGTVPLPNARLAGQARAALLSGRTLLYVERDRQISWAGMQWTRTPTMNSRTYSLPVQAGGIETYLRSHRRLYEDRAFTATDQLAIVRDLVDYAQAQPGGDLGITIDYAQTSGVLRDRQYSRYDHNYVGELIDQLATVEDGFEWRVQAYQDDTGQRHRALRLGYPRLTAGATDMVLSLPGPITGYTLPENASGMANTWQSRGASTNTNQASDSSPLMSALLTTPADIAAGWPRLDGSSSYSSVNVQSTLDEHATADLARARRPVTIPSVVYRSDGMAPPQLGGTVLLRIDDLWFSEGLRARYRIVGYRVEAAERGRAESTSLFLEVI